MEDSRRRNNKWTPRLRRRTILSKGMLPMETFHADRDETAGETVFVILRERKRGERGGRGDSNVRGRLSRARECVDLTRVVRG